MEFRLRTPPEWGPDPVPPEKRILRGFDFFVLWFSLGVGLLVMIAGMLLPLLLGLSLAESALVILVGSVVGSLMLAAAGPIGSRYGVPSMVSLRPVLGRVGSYVPTALNVLQLVGWTSFEILIMGEAASDLVRAPQGGLVNFAFLGVFGVFCGLLALGGPLLVVRQWLEKFGIWLVIGSTVWLSYALFTTPGYGWGGFTSPTANLLLGLDLVIVLPISWWPLLSDYNRFARRPREAAAGTAVGYTLANIWFFLLGAGMFLILGQASPSLAILGLGFGGVALLFILADETDNGFANIYSTAVSAQNLRARWPQRTLVLVSTAIGIVLAGILTAMGGIAAALNYEFFLLLIGGFFVPLLGVLASDWFLVRRGRYDPAEFGTGAPRVRWAALVSWAAGIVVYFLLSGISLFNLGAVFPGIGGSIPSFLVAAGLHAVIARALDARVTSTSTS